MPLKLFTYGTLPFLAQVYRDFPLTLLCEDDHSRRIRWGGHVACMGRSDRHIGFWWQNLKEIEHWAWM